tara:strand:+ start:13585 stop:14016 length:432 start_codon:yes stop_codon:yes gene_type:complete
MDNQIKREFIYKITVIDQDMDYEWATKLRNEFYELHLENVLVAGDKSVITIASYISTDILAYETQCLDDNNFYDLNMFIVHMDNIQERDCITIGQLGTHRIVYSENYQADRYDDRVKAHFVHKSRVIDSFINIINESISKWRK